MEADGEDEDGRERMKREGGKAWAEVGVGEKDEEGN